MLVAHRNLAVIKVFICHPIVAEHARNASSSPGVNASNPVLSGISTISGVPFPNNGVIEGE